MANGPLDLNALMRQAALSRFGNQLTSIGAGLMSGGVRGLGPGLAAAAQSGGSPMQDMAGLMQIQRMQQDAQRQQQLAGMSDDLFTDPTLRALSQVDMQKALELKAAREGKTPTPFGAFLAGDPKAEEWRRMQPGTNVTVNMPPPVQTSTAADIEKRILAAEDTLSLLNQAERDYDESFSTWGGQAQNWWSGVQERAGVELTPEQESRLSAYTSWASNVELNQRKVINQLTGAAMTEAEAKAFGKIAPSDKDSPTQFKTKLGNSQRTIRNTIIRYNWAKNKGLDPMKTGVALDDVPDLVRRREAELNAEYAGLPDEERDRLVEQQMRREFIGGQVR